MKCPKLKSRRRRFKNELFKDEKFKNEVQRFKKIQKGQKIQGPAEAKNKSVKFLTQSGRDFFESPKTFGPINYQKSN